MQNLAPIALFVYNRPEHTRRTLTYLKKNLLADESRLFIFSDAAKKETDRAKVEEVRHLITEITGFKSVKVIERKHNLGLAMSIIDGVTQLVKDYGKVIVFEDDMLSSEYTLQYFNEALTRYATEDKVMHIGAYMFDLKDKSLPQTFFYPIITSWGWATWARAWKHFEADIDKIIQQIDDEKKHRFTIEGTMNFWKQVKEFKAGKNNSWAIRWYASVFLKGGLSLHPSKSLVHNIGHDGTGTHSNIEDMYSVQISRQPVTQFPADITENRQAHLAIKNFLKNRKGTLLQRGLRLVKQLRVKYLQKQK
ncbi:sugar transferase [Mucilaginibacter hurinus]|uniref:Sugar transferase n=1 Tax=Mucilaginibacter hurinus TaxID=2201324 RepID=A0A367GMT5_9SPHI|nr:glycosyltransferase [Mucilaginibacter hurinus]RCH54620.1 sugar transferase [Mucilaginibacter hurinus]